jgi:hypothetical protein
LHLRFVAYLAIVLAGVTLCAGSGAVAHRALAPAPSESAAEETEPTEESAPTSQRRARRAARRAWLQARRVPRRPRPASRRRDDRFAPIDPTAAPAAARGTPHRGPPVATDD